jgi:hypothetical protein
MPTRLRPRTLASAATRILSRALSGKGRQQITVACGPDRERFDPPTLMGLARRVNAQPTAPLFCQRRRKIHKRLSANGLRAASIQGDGFMLESLAAHVVTLTTSMDTARFMTDAGPAHIKTMGN